VLSGDSQPLIFEASSPWPHAVIDGLVKPHLIREVMNEVDRALIMSSHTVGTWRSMNDTSQVYRN
jgi:hypothetical protein